MKPTVSARAHRLSIDALRPFAAPGYSLFWSATALWHLIRWMDMLVMGWLVFDTTGSAWHVALVGFYRSLPLLVFGLFAGAVLDQISRRLLMLVSQSISFVSSAAVFALILTDHFTFEAAVIANLALGLTWAVDWQVRRGLIPDLVGKDLVMQAVILEAVSMNLSKVIGPLAGGSLIDVVGVGTCYALMACLYAIQIAMIWQLDVPGRTVEAVSVNRLRYLREGWGEIVRNQPILGVLAITVVANVLVFPYQQLLPVFAGNVLHVGPAALGALGAGNGIGTLVGLLLLMRVGKQGRGGSVFIVGSIAMSISLLGFAFSTNFLASFVLLVISGVGQAGFSTFQSTLVLVNASETLRGRALSALTFAIGTAPVGLLAIGALADRFDAPAALTGATALASIFMVYVVVAVPGLRKSS